MWKVYISRFANRHLLRGKPNQMISSRCYVEHHPRVERFINRLFWWQPNHCRQSFLWEKCYEKTNEAATRRTQETTSSGTVVKEEHTTALAASQNEG